MLMLTLVIGISFWFLNFVQENKKLNSIPLGGSFILTDQDGSIYNSSVIKKKKLIYFGYTFCPDVCPFDILKISKLFDNNPDLIDKIQPIFITVDPQRDTPKNIKSFLENFNSNLIGLTGSKKRNKICNK